MTHAKPKVFISYSHDSPEHKERVLCFSDRLCKDGIDSYIDQYELGPAKGWARWTLDQIEKADFVVIVCTKIYNHRFKGNEEVGKGKGVKWEGAILMQELYDAEAQNTRFIPVVFQKDDAEFIPTLLRDFQFYIIGTEEGYEDFYRKITNQPRIVKPHSGEIKKLSTDTQDTVKSINENGRLDKKMIELRLEGDLDDFPKENQDKFFNAIKELLKISDLKIVSIQSGSILISLELPSDQAKRLLWAVKSGALEEYGVIDAKFKESKKPTVLALLNALLDGLTVQLPRIAAVEAATDRWEDGEVGNGLLGWYIAPDRQEPERLIIRIDSNELALEGKILQLSAGSWRDEVRLSRITAKQVGGQIVIEPEEVKNLPANVDLSIRVIE